jgi:hypothetical protein
VGKIVGPVLFGSAWCGWTRWTVMVLDLLPRRPQPRLVRGGAG